MSILCVRFFNLDRYCITLTGCLPQNMWLDSHSLKYLAAMLMMIMKQPVYWWFSALSANCSASACDARHSLTVQCVSTNYTVFGSVSVCLSASLVYCGKTAELVIACPDVIFLWMFYLGVRTPWTASEHDAVMRHLKDHLADDQPLPGKVIIEKCLAEEPCLQNRKWKMVKDYCRRQKLKKDWIWHWKVIHLQNLISVHCHAQYLLWNQFVAVYSNYPNYDSWQKYDRNLHVAQHSSSGHCLCVGLHLFCYRNMWSNFSEAFVDGNNPSDTNLYNDSISVHCLL